MSAFAKAVGQFQLKTKGLSEQVVRKICFDLASKIIYRTPVDTGRARANWQASINAPNLSQLTSTDKGGGSAVLRAVDTAKDAPGNIFYLTNNLPYIMKLEYGGYNDGPKTMGGYSRQAPRGMVRISIAEIKAQLAR